jgi:hypothetical protein
MISTNRRSFKETQITKSKKKKTENSTSYAYTIKTKRTWPKIFNKKEPQNLNSYKERRAC